MMKALISNFLALFVAASSDGGLLHPHHKDAPVYGSYRDSLQRPQDPGYYYQYQYEQGTKGIYHD